METVLNIMASTMSAENIRMNIIASNMANAGNVNGNEKEVYHARYPVFSEIKQRISGISQQDQAIGGVRVSHIHENNAPLKWRFEPAHPLADKDGRIFVSDVVPIEEMSNMIDASRQYQASVDTMNSVKNLMMQTIKAIKEI